MNSSNPEGKSYLSLRSERNWPRRLYFLPESLLLLLVLHCLVSTRIASASETISFSLTILHTSEHHGTALPIERMGEPRVGGMAARATLIASVRQESEAVLLLDSGDILIGSALSSFFRGEPDVQAMNLMGYHAMAAGNHEFDFGIDHLQRLQKLADFPFLCSNITGILRELPCRDYTLARVGTFTIGVIGILGQRNFPDSFNREVVDLLQFQEPIRTTRTLAETLKREHGADLVLAVTHQETDEDLALLAGAPEVDVIIGGHTVGFDGLYSPKAPASVERLRDPGRVFVKTHRQGQTLGRLDLNLIKNPDGSTRISLAKAGNLPVTERVQPNPPVQALIEGYSRKLEAESATVIGRSLVKLNGETSDVRSRETNLGNLLADLLRRKFRTQIALVNGGQIRDSIPPGPVDFQRVLSVLPFDSATVTFSLTGEQLLLALENSASRLPAFNGRFLQISGLRVAYEVSSPPGKRVREVMIGGEALNPTQHYTVATDSFLADGGDGYTMFESATHRIDRQVPMRDLLLEALRAGPIKASLSGRMHFVVPSRSSQNPGTTGSTRLGEVMSRTTDSSEMLAK